MTFLSNKNWLNDLVFLTDITQHLFDLNLRLQGKGQFVNKLFEHICDLEKKLELFQFQLSRVTLTHFVCLATKKLEFPYLDCAKYGASVQKLRDEFANRFPHFSQNKIKLKLFAQSFNLAVAEDCQMELIDLQADMDTKKKYSENSLVDLYKLYVCERFPNLSRHTKRLASLFGSNFSLKRSSPKPDVEVS